MRFGASAGLRVGNRWVKKPSVSADASTTPSGQTAFAQHMLCIVVPRILSRNICCVTVRVSIVPKVVDHAQRRAELLGAAWQVIAQEGIEAATVRRIAAAAGCSTGRVTHYFENKNDVLVTALRLVHTQAASRMAERLADHQGIDALRCIVLEALPLDDERRLEWKVWLAFWGRASVDSELRREHRRRYKEWRTLLRRQVRNAVAAGDLDATIELNVTVDHLSATIDGLGIQTILEPAAFPTKRVQVLVDRLLATLDRPSEDIDTRKES